jgi:hypothetical protein
MKGIREPKLSKVERVTFSIGFHILQIFQEVSRPSGVVTDVGDGYGFGTNHPHRRGAATVITVVAVLRVATCLSVCFSRLLTEDFLRITMSSE